MLHIHYTNNPDYFSRIWNLKRLIGLQIKNPQATSRKRQASSAKLGKLQAASCKRQESASRKRASPQAPSSESHKPQASSDKQQASWFLKPSLTRAKIQVPGNNLKEPWLGFLASINVFFGWCTWKEIWWGEKRILLPDVTFSSTVKKWELSL